MQFSGEEIFDLAYGDLWDRITDMEFLSQVIPDLDRVESVDPKKLIVRVRPGLSFLSGTLKLTFELISENRPESAQLRVTGKGIGSGIVIETDLKLVTLGENTKLKWEAKVVERKGLLKPVGASLIQMAAKKVIADVLSNFRDAL